MESALRPSQKSVEGKHSHDLIHGYRRHMQQLNHFHLGRLHNHLQIRWQDIVPDTEVLKQTDNSSSMGSLSCARHS